MENLLDFGMAKPAPEIGTGFSIVLFCQKWFGALSRYGDILAAIAALPLWSGTQ
ncbi:hypothetical protein [Devosia sp.]|uniref:hypothetical protein n=1 Tax=Devosia sp. TaxID=1871048 RepID=UPI002602083D|nr:hypothetical protein [Devosia sp.]